MDVKTSIFRTGRRDIWLLAQKHIVISWHTKKAFTFALHSTNLFEEYYQNWLSQQSNNFGFAALNPSMIFTTRPTTPAQN